MPSRAEHSAVFRPPALGECERADLFGDGSQVSLALQWRTRRIASAERGFFWPFRPVCSHSPNHNVGLTRRNELWEPIVIFAVYVRPSLSLARRLPQPIPMSGPRCARKSCSDANHQITGIRHAWTFDEFYSAMAVQGLDTNGDGVFSAEELKPLGGSEHQVAQGFRLLHLRAYRATTTSCPLKPPVELFARLRQGLAHASLHAAPREAGRYARPGGRRSTSTIPPSSSPSVSPPKSR